MKPLVVISIALLLFSCGSLEERKLIFKRTMATVGYCSFENFTWEDTGEDARFQRIEPDWHNNWHVTQCAGRDPEPLECYFGFFGLAGELAVRCKTEDGEEEDYRRLTGLIE
jgi:hypothetical protein